MWLFIIQCILTVTVNFLSFRDSHAFLKQFCLKCKVILIDCDCEQCCDFHSNLSKFIDVVCCMSDFAVNNAELDFDTTEDSNRSSRKRKGKNTDSNYSDKSVSHETMLDSVLASVNEQIQNEVEDSFIRYSSQSSRSYKYRARRSRRNRSQSDSNNSMDQENEKKSHKKRSKEKKSNNNNSDAASSKNRKDKTEHSKNRSILSSIKAINIKLPALNTTESGNKSPTTSQNKTPIEDHSIEINT